MSNTVKKTDVIDTDLRLDDLQLITILKNKKSIFLPNIFKVYDSIKDLLNTRIPKVFSNYTLHNVDHSFRIMQYMAKLVSNPDQLDELEITLLIYSALLHDIGMAVSEDRIHDIKKDKYQYSNIKFSSMKKMMKNIDDNLVLEEYVRKAHATFSASYIRENHIDEFTIPKLPSLSFSKELALICESHTHDFDFIKRNLSTYEVRGDYHFNSQFIASILRLADILDIDSNRTPYNLYKMINPVGKGDSEWKQHFVISNNDKIHYNPKTQQKRIVFHGKSINASIHRKLLTYINWVETELVNTCNLVANMPPQYQMIYELKPEINIQAEGYSFSDYKMTLDFKAISVLLMGEKIYGSRSLGLRELIQNSIDACKIRQENEKLQHEFGQEEYKPKIKVVLDKEKNQVSIRDNGIGMSIDIIKNHFLNIGVSYYASADFQLNDYDYKPIGNFGIGFLSCFMLSDTVIVTTRHFNSKYKYVIELEKSSEYTSLTELEDVSFDGTEVILNYSKFMESFENKLDLVKDFLSTYFLTDGIEFEIVDKNAKTKHSISNPLNQKEKEDAGVVRIELSKYLKEMDGYALLKPKTHFIKDFSDLNFEGELYIYNKVSKLEKVKNKSDLKIDDYLVEQQISYLTIPLVSYDAESDYLNGLKFTENDVDEVIRKMDRDLNWISILVDKKYYDDLDEKRLYDMDKIIDNLYYEALVALGHQKDCETKCFVKNIRLFEGEKNKLYMPFDEKEQTPSYLSFFHPFFGKNPGDLFVRSVRIKDFRFSLGFISSIFEVVKIRLNVSSKKLIPDISRNNLDPMSTELLNYIVSKSIHVGACEKLNIDSPEKATLKKFIQSYYKRVTEFEI